MNTIHPPAGKSKQETRQEDGEPYYGRFPLAIVSSGAWAQCTLIEKAVCGALVSYIRSEKKWTAWPSVETLAEKAGIHPRNVPKATGGLERKGILTKRFTGRGVEYTLTGDAHATAKAYQPTVKSVHRDDHGRYTVATNATQGNSTTYANSYPHQMDGSYPHQMDTKETSLSKQIKETLSPANAVGENAAYALGEEGTEAALLLVNDTTVSQRQKARDGGEVGNGEGHILPLDQGKRRHKEKRIGKKGTVVQLSRELTDTLEHNVRTFSARVLIKQDISDTECLQHVHFLREVLIKKKHRTVDEITDVMQWLDEGNYKGTVHSIYILNSPVFDQALQQIQEAKAVEAEAAERQRRQEAATATEEAEEQARRNQKQAEDAAKFAALPEDDQARLMARAERQYGHKLGETEWFDSLLRLTAYRLTNEEAEEKAKADRMVKIREAMAAQRREQQPTVAITPPLPEIPEADIDAVIHDTHRALNQQIMVERLPIYRESIRREIRNGGYTFEHLVEATRRVKGGLREVNGDPITNFGLLRFLAHTISKERLAA